MRFPSVTLTLLVCSVAAQAQASPSTSLQGTAESVSRAEANSSQRLHGSGNEAPGRAPYHPHGMRPGNRWHLAGDNKQGEAAEIGFRPRATSYQDRDGVTSRVAQNLTEVTPTGKRKIRDWKPGWIKIRSDASNQPLFHRGHGAGSE